MKTIYSYFIILAGILTLASCDSLLDIDKPIDSISRETTYSTEGGITATRNGLYTKHFFGNQLYMFDMDVFGSLISDDLVSISTYYKPGYENSYTPSTTPIKKYWNSTYSCIFSVNDFLDAATGSSAITKTLLDKYLGEAHWFRAFDYFLLVNLFGGVPLVTTALPENISSNSVLPRSSASDTYNLIISDLKQAQALMEHSTEGNDMITSYAATALLARSYLYTEQWQSAADEASKLIPVNDGGTGTGFQLETIDRVFKTTSKETILQSNQSGYYGDFFIGYCYTGAQFTAWGEDNYKYFFISPLLVAALQSDHNDLRNQWIHIYKPQQKYDVYYPYKYKNGNTPANTTDYECQVFLRLAEQYLIRAEANAHLGNLTQAVIDINKIRNRAGEVDFQSTSKSEILTEIETQRQKEFFCEGANRWMDLNRTGRSDYFYKNAGYKNWSSYKSLMPIPAEELISNPFLKQNPGW